MAKNQFPIWTPDSSDIQAQRAWIEKQIEEIGSEKIQELVSRAVEARKGAYAPYSKFLVGASLLTISGKIYTGCNIENVNYTNSGHAETSAIHHAIVNGEARKNRRFIKAMVDVTDEKDPSGPCCYCRQTMLEFADNMIHIVANEKGEVCFITSLAILAPKAFTPSNLGIA